MVELAEPSKTKAGWSEGTNDSLRATCEWSKGGRPRARSASAVRGLAYIQAERWRDFCLLHQNRDSARRSIQGCP